jgi:hypothetical protein
MAPQKNGAVEWLHGYWEGFDSEHTYGTTTLMGNDRTSLRGVLQRIGGVSFPRLQDRVSVSDVIEMLAQLADIHTATLRDHERTKEELAALRRDVDAARRIFGNTLTP